MTLLRKQQEQCQPQIIEPLVNILEEEKEIVLEAEMVGLTKDDVSLDLKGDELTLKGRVGRTDDGVPKGYTVLYKERCPLEYRRTFIIGDEIDKSKIDAQYANGILKVKLYKAEKAQPKKIEIT